MIRELEITAEDVDKMLNKVADTYEEDVDVLVSSMTSLLEPVMVISPV